MSTVQITDKMLDDMPFLKKIIERELNERILLYYQVYQDEMIQELLEGSGKNSDLRGILNLPRNIKR